MITTFGGGVGAGKFLQGLYGLMAKEDLNIVVNSADDINIFDVRVSPDIDSVLYWLSGRVDKKKGWGIKNDTFEFLKKQKQSESWFNLGDKDLKENLEKSLLIKKGITLQKVVDIQRKKLKITKARIFPMTNDIVETHIKIGEKEIHFQEYLIKLKMKPKVDKIIFRNIRKSKPANGLIDCILNSKLLIFCPSNPIISIDPILSVPGIQKAIKQSKGVKVAISPIVNQKAFKGPVLQLMKAKKLEPSVLGVVKFYREIVNYIMIDDLDKKHTDKIYSAGIIPLINDIKMVNIKVSESMAQSILNLI